MQYRMNAFADDPFFSDVSSEMHRMDRHFENVFGDFGRIGFESALDYSGREREGRARASQKERRNSDTSSNRAVQPFGNLMADPFSMMSTMMRNMEQVMQRQTADTNGVNCYSSSSFYSYSSDGRSAPRVVEAHAAERQAPGGVRETRRAYRDSETGIARMAIGHHVDDRAHIIERSENRITGQREQRNEFRGIDEADAELFNQEWRQRVRGSSLDHRLRHGSAGRDRTIEYRSNNDQSERRRK